jgi:predicted TIM-barrel fold metal-dependent hydrolase
MRIDFHAHFTPPLTPAEMDDLCRNEPYWGLLLHPPDGARSIQGWATAERMLQDMDAAGIERVVLQGEYRRTHEACVARNNQVLELTRRWPDRLAAFAMLQPAAGQALDELQRCLDAGMRGVGELNPYAQGHSMDHPGFRRLAEACIEHDVPLCLHVSEEIGRYYLGKSTTPLRHYYELARRYPELKLILAHWGGGLFFYELMPKVRRDLRNVWYDTAASPLLYRTSSIFEVALRCVDHRKLLFGSDYPLLLYPSRQSEPDFRPFLAQVQAVDMPPAVRRDLMGDNSARLLGLLPDLRSSEEGRELPQLEEPGAPIGGFMAVTMVAHHWPQTRDVFEKHHIPWQDSPVPCWEPIVQAAAARGYGPADQQRLLEELNEAIGD